MKMGVLDYWILNAVFWFRTLKQFKKFPVRISVGVEIGLRRNLDSLNHISVDFCLTKGNKFRGSIGFVLKK